MHGTLSNLIAFLGAIGLASVVAPRLKVPAPVLLAVVGLAWGSIPGRMAPDIDPHVVLSVFLPPLLYAEAWRASWHDFRRWLRPILSLGIGLVAFTILTAGIAAKLVLPGLDWSVCFLIGAVVSPTDTVAVHAVLARLRVPRRITAIIGGESLINDATGLLGAQLAVVVTLTGVFRASSIVTEFARISAVSLAIGVAAGALAERAGASGVLAVVVAGFIASWRIDLVAPESRVDLTQSWDIVTFILNGMMFLFVGLAIPRLAADPSSSGGFLVEGLVIGVAVVLTRLAWFWPAAYIPLWLSRRLREKEGGYPPARAIVLGGWCGVRGAVSLAAALALPAALPDGAPFPGRAAVEAATLVTIVVTLIGQGSTIGPLVRWMGLPSDPTTEAETRKAREAMLSAGVARLDAFCAEKSCPVAVYRYREVLLDRLAEQRDIEESERRHATRRLEVSREVRRAVWQAESAELLRLRDGGQINDRDHQDLQLELDREHADLTAA